MQAVDRDQQDVLDGYATVAITVVAARGVAVGRVGRTGGHGQPDRRDRGRHECSAGRAELGTSGEHTTPFALAGWSRCSMGAPPGAGERRVPGVLALS